jgi:uncharacterized protein YehS (DUF1456 family)
VINNDVLRRLRYALNITELKVVELFNLAGYDIGREELEGIFKKEDEIGYRECSDLVMERFLEGLIIGRRGRREESGQGRTTAPRRSAKLTNNDILKGIRIALELRDEDIIGIMARSGVELSKPESTALFRKRGQTNFRPCGDQFLRNFLVGLTAKYRG